MVLKEESEGKGRIHVRRKIFHLFLGTVFIISMINLQELKWFFLAVLAFGAVLSFVQEKRKLPVITWFLDRYDKSSDRVPGQGPLTFFVGAVLVWFLFPKDIAIASIIVLTFGDPIAYLGGKLIGGPRFPWNRNKTFSGSVSFLIIPAFLILMIYGPVEAVIVPLAGALVESLKLSGSFFSDDNILVPIGTAVPAWLLSVSFGLF